MKKLCVGGEDYTTLERLGEGHYGAVYRCCRMRDHVECAVKVIDPRRLAQDDGCDDAAAMIVQTMVEREVDALREVSPHPNIIAFVDYCCLVDTHQLLIITEFVGGGNLLSHVATRIEAFHEATVANIARQLAIAVDYCHGKCVVHRDLKLDNVLVDNVDFKWEKCYDANGAIVGLHTLEIYSVKLCDFGFAKILGDSFTKTRSRLGTYKYSAPEIGLSNPDALDSVLSRMENGNRLDYDPFKADAFSLGVIYYALLCLGFPAREKDGAHRANKTWKSLSVGATSLIDALLCHDPDMRLTSEEILSHPWLSSKSEGTLGDPQQVPESVLAKQSSLQQSQNLLACIHALHTLMIEVQHERRGVSITFAAAKPSQQDSLQWYFQATDKRISDAETIARKSGSPLDIEPVRSIIKGARDSFVHPSHDTNVDMFFLVYNQVWSMLVDMIQLRLRAAADSRGMNARQAEEDFQSSAAVVEQLERELIFLSDRPHSSMAADKLGRLSRIIQGRKVLLKHSKVSCSASLEYAEEQLCSQQMAPDWHLALIQIIEECTKSMHEVIAMELAADLRSLIGGSATSVEIAPPPKQWSCFECFACVDGLFGFSLGDSKERRL